MKSVQQMITEAAAEITGHTATESWRRAQEENALLVDIRDVDEQRVLLLGATP